MRGRRQRHLDGLRGIAALAVVIEHVAGLVPGRFLIVGNGPLGQIATNIVSFPFRCGVFAVYVFFAISGVVIASAADENKPWPLSLISRYLRLTVPMLAASLLAWTLLKIYPDELVAIGRFLPDHLTTDVYQQGDTSLLDAFIEPIWSVYVSGASYLDPVLWSMRAELFGSLGIFTFYRFAPINARIPGALAVAALLALVDHWRYVTFAIGVVFYEVNKRRPVGGRFGPGPLITGLGLLCALAGDVATAHFTGAAVSEVIVVDGDYRIIAYVFGALLIVFGVMSGGENRDVLLLKGPQFLGRISYGLYLVHMPLLFTVFAALYLALGTPPGGPLLAIWAMTFLTAAIGAGYCMTRLVDEPWSAIRRRVEKLIAAGRKAERVAIF